MCIFSFRSLFKFTEYGTALYVGMCLYSRTPCITVQCVSTYCLSVQKNETKIGRADNSKIYIRVRRLVHASFTIENSPLITLLNEHARVQSHTHTQNRKIKNKLGKFNPSTNFLDSLSVLSEKTTFFAAKKNNKSVHVRAQKYIILLRLSRHFSDQEYV